MSETFQKILIKSDLIGGISDTVKFGVVKGSQNHTSMTYNAISQTPSSQVYNIAVPSLETVISREVLWSSTVTLRITGTNKPANQFLVNYGATDALSAFPLQSLVNTMTSTINNNTVAINMSDVLPAMLRLCDPEDLACYNDLTPTTLDYLGDYKDGVDLANFQIDRVQNGADAATGRLIVVDPSAALTTQGADGNGANRGTAPQSFISYPNNVLGFDMNRLAGTSKQHRPRGSYRLLGIWVNDAAAAPNGRRLPRVGDNEVFVQFRVTEPLMLSPFIFGSPHGKQGFYGIQTLNFQMNMLQNASRAWRSVRFGNYTKSATIESFSDSSLRFQFLTPHASELLPSRNVVPYYELPVYRTTNLPDFPGRGNGECDPATGVFPEPRSVTVNSANIQLNGIPDKLLICVRRSGNLTCCDTDRLLTINSIRINFNNQAGLLSSMSPEQLYTNSVLSGLKNMSYDEFRGVTVSVSGRGNGTSEPFTPFSGIGSRIVGAGADDNIPGFKYIATTGTLLVLNFAEVIQLTDEYYAPGSLGTFNLQLQLECQNNHADDWAANQAELIIIPVNSGVFVNERGTSSTFLSLLTKQDVLSTLDQQPYTNFEVRRMVGGASFGENLRSGLQWLRSKFNDMAPMAKNALMSTGNPYAQTGAAVLGALGYGKGHHKSIEHRVA